MGARRIGRKGTGRGEGQRGLKGVEGKALGGGGQDRGRKCTARGWGTGRRRG